MAWWLAVGAVGWMACAERVAWGLGAGGGVLARRASAVRAVEGAGALDATGRVDGAAAAKARVLRGAQEVDRGFSASRGAARRLAADVAALEAFGGRASPTESPLLLGDWELIFTDAVDVLSLKLLPAQLGAIRQNLRAGKEPRTLGASNEVELQPLLNQWVAPPLRAPAVTYSVQADCRVLDERRVSLVFVGGKLQLPVLPAVASTLPSPLIDALQELVRGRIYLETTYLDEDVRVARGPNRELYVLSRIL
ncbi:hypothetical protein AB1Y20_017876 [Prymnesium parvum]|uniref:Plastid lipid-associated protein/fibrillin conserved domain-containing protein n=1 Tax=Prymnesium parvum TaxID=97485 RepID=A0AB34JNA3_PRYPA